MEIVDGRGLNMKKTRIRNKTRVKEWFETNTRTSKADCCRALKLSYSTILSLVKEIESDCKGGQ